MVETLMQQLWLAPRRAAILCVRLYQRTLSPDHGPLRHLWTYGYCRHEPTCSQYAVEQLQRRGLIVGTLLSVGRTLMCNPLRKPSERKLRSLAEKQLHSNR